MPLQPCKIGGRVGVRWGKSGHCYTGPGATAKARRQERAIRASGWTGNAVLRIDPTRTIMLRKKFVADIVRRFNRLKRRIWRLVVDEDAFGLKIKRFPFNEEQDDGSNGRTGGDEHTHEGNAGDGVVQLSDSQGVKGNQRRISQGEGTQGGRASSKFGPGQARPGGGEAAPTLHQRFAFQSTPNQVAEFQRWLQAQIQVEVMAGASQEAIERVYWTEYTKEGYRKGAGRAFDDTKRPYARGYAEAGTPTSDFYKGTRHQFLESAFARPVAVEKVRLLAGRVFTDLKGINQALSTEINRSLTDSLVRGESPLTVGRRLNKIVDGYKNRGMTMARTEIIRAHAEGQLDAMEILGVEKVGVMVEWSVSGLGTTAAGNPTPCDACAAMEGSVMKIKEARGLLPLHPNCMCSYVPANVGESKKGQKRSKEEVEKALDDAIRATMPKFKKRTFAEQKARSKWAGADRTIARRRPRSVLDRPKLKPRPTPTPAAKPKPIPPAKPKVVKPKPKPLQQVPRPIQASVKSAEENARWLKAEEARLNRGGHERLSDYITGGKHREIRRASNFFDEYGWDARAVDNPFPPDMMAHSHWEQRRKQAAKWRGHARQITKTIDRAPDYQGRLYRGMNIDERRVDEIIESGKWQSEPIQSWSKTAKEAEKFGGGRDTGWKFVTDLDGSVPSADVSFLGPEAEVLTGRHRFTIQFVDRERRLVYVSPSKTIPIPSLPKPTVPTPT